MRWWILLLLPLAAAPALGIVGLGHMQPIQEVTIPQGLSYTTPLYFYNAYGDRITHVAATITLETPPVRVTLDPDKHVAAYNISGLITNVTESTLACPRGKTGLPPGVIPSLEQAYTYPTGDPNCPVRNAYILAPTGDGYLPSAVINVTFDVPENTPPGNYPVRIEANGFVIGETGNLLPGISGAFAYNVIVRRPGPITEIPVTPTPSATPGPAGGPDIGALLPYIGIGGAVAGGMAGMYLLGRRGRP
ncbi:MAG: hypothetical protein QXO51_05510 [Halobacteria archaeon]